MLLLGLQRCGQSSLLLLNAEAWPVFSLHYELEPPSCPNRKHCCAYSDGCQCLCMLMSFCWVAELIKVLWNHRSVYIFCSHFECNERIEKQASGSAGQNAWSPW
ncbi:hypothetical protein COCON_G00178260 [Conger conger]|uniref:Uncharacterized protein n=1 Tax=Conger conger TaxID=82655 RepID=A0A9Q1D519_CONCO|nr:hypothetical protein COCON_G00178260 [Conger conger]